MFDFLMVSTRSPKQGVVEIYPKFIITKSSDLMIRGGDFYAVWVEERGLWSTDELDALRLIDRELDKYYEEHRKELDANSVRVLHLWDAGSGMIDAWHKYCQKQMRDDFVMLDEQIIFSNTDVKKNDYASKKLSYPLEKGEISAYEKLMSTLYSEEERHKIEWAIGSIVTGDSKTLQKFLVFYGAVGTGKSTVLNIIQQLFDGYFTVFDAKALGSSNNAFALEAFKNNPLVAIQHDGDLSRIEDNTRINSLVSHELMTVNEKFKSAYSNRFKAFLFMGTNKPVRITDAKSGLLRRLIDVSPSGNKLPMLEYQKAVGQIPFELGAIAYHCRGVFLANPEAYDDYIPVSMLGASNDFYNFVMDSFAVFENENGTTLKSAWERYKNYCEDAKVGYPLSQRAFKEELKNYFREFFERYTADDGTRMRSYYRGFRTEKFVENVEKPKAIDIPKIPVLALNATVSLLDDFCNDCAAQYAVDDKPQFRWSDVKTTLREIDTSKTHYVKLPENHIVIDFDIPADDGGKSLERNLKAAAKFPPTYAELSKSGKGVHLHYIYKGDVNRLSRVYEPNVEIKVFVGKSALRRKLTRCNDIPIAEISSGLPTKGETKMVDKTNLTNEKALRTLIKKNLNKEYHSATKPSVDFIHHALLEMYESGKPYDVSDMYNDILAFAAGSTNQAKECIKLVNKMHFKSADAGAPVSNDGDPLIFYDIELFPNLFLVNWKKEGKNQPVIRMINPSPAEIEELLKFRLVGFNCRRYDNHLLYARLMGYSIEQVYDLSQKIINEGKGFFGEAYNISYTDVYDFSSKKQSLKKFEIELGIHHEELGLPWDQPVPEEMWTKVAEYCDNDVIATEVVFNARKADFTARQILADLAGMTVNDTTNSLTTRIIFGNNRKPQGEFNYRNLAEPVYELDPETEAFLKEACPDMMSKLHGEAKSKLPYFPGYKFERGKSTYRGEEVSEGGQVYAELGIHVNVALLDVASMHPHSAIAEVLFGVRFTKAFRDIVEGRVSIKHESWDVVNKMLDGKLTPYIQKVINGEMKTKDLANALKMAINSVYGLTNASFENPFRDPRNIDNIVAKRGALFMIDLKHEVQKRGFTVAHIKTDSIKIPNATPEIIEFVKKFGRDYGYEFEHEATYERMCLVNNAVYIAKYKDGDWTATGTQFQVPYVFKSLFSKEAINFEDMCETKSVTSAIYLDFNEELPNVEVFEKVKLYRGYTSDQLSRADENTLNAWAHLSDEELANRIAEGHNYRFVGKVGSFCPMKPGCGGGLLVRETENKKTGKKGYSAVTGTKGYRWMEAEMVRHLGKENDIDLSYYNDLVNEAVNEISKYGDFELFVSDDPIPEANAIVDWPPDEYIPPVGYMPCGREKCTGCENFTNDAFHIDCRLGYDVFPF